MFEVLVFVYENYWRGDACPQWEHLGRKLSAVGFEQAFQRLGPVAATPRPQDHVMRAGNGVDAVHLHKADTVDQGCQSGAGNAPPPLLQPLLNCRAAEPEG